ncbi:cupin domain-containing protein [Hyphococcus flavus]|uniref:Cupin domain-containing protein n=1 Tax=Hyphococcus flavus TaxID=1866326 RepID=A0AAE9ZFH1_9PROT|nr:cupin domain-containing protein [Hyphococcus flavus]WDI32855.1 cupin domain-containing protein [Hyphococcus flavus]
MPKLNLKDVKPRTGCAYPAPYDAHCIGRSKIGLGDLGGLNQFGVNLTRLAPGAASAHKHWHQNEDELVYMLEGEAVLVEDDGETVMRAGDVATFKAGVQVGHMMVNRSNREVVFLEVRTRAAEEVSSYTDPDIDLQMIKSAAGWVATRKDGAPY